MTFGLVRCNQHPPKRLASSATARLRQRTGVARPTKYCPTFQKSETRDKLTLSFLR